MVDEVEEVRWPPRDPEALKLMKKVNLCLNLVLNWFPFFCWVLCIIHGEVFLSTLFMCSSYWEVFLSTLHCHIKSKPFHVTMKFLLTKLVNLCPSPIDLRLHENLISTIIVFVDTIDCLEEWKSCRIAMNGVIERKEANTNLEMVASAALLFWWVYLFDWTAVLKYM